MKRLIFLLLALPVLSFGQIGIGGNNTVGTFGNPGGGGGSGPYSPTSFTNNAVLIGGGTGAIQSTGITSSSGGSSFTGASSTDLTLNAGTGGNNCVNLVASGNKANTSNQCFAITGGNQGPSGTGCLELSFGSSQGFINAVARGSASYPLFLNSTGSFVIINSSTNNALNTLQVNGDIETASPSVTAASGTGITVNQTGVIRHVTYKVTLTFAAYSAAAKTADVTIATLPAKTKLIGIIEDVTTGFTGGGETVATFKVGTAAGGTTILLSNSCFTTATWGLADADAGTSFTRAAQVQGGYIPNWSGTQIINSRLTTTTNNTSGLTAGSVTYYIDTLVYP